MQRFRECVVAVSLAVLLANGAATGTMRAHAHRAGHVDDGIIATILDLLGLTPQNKVSIPPG